MRLTDEELGRVLHEASYPVTPWDRLGLLGRQPWVASARAVRLAVLKSEVLPELREALEACDQDAAVDVRMAVARWAEEVERT